MVWIDPYLNMYLFFYNFRLITLESRDAIHQHQGERRGNVNLSVLLEDITTVVLEWLKLTTAGLWDGHSIHCTTEAPHISSTSQQHLQQHLQQHHSKNIYSISSHFITSLPRWVRPLISSPTFLASYLQKDHPWAWIQKSPSYPASSSVGCEVRWWEPQTFGFPRAGVVELLKSSSGKKNPIITTLNWPKYFLLGLIRY